MINGLFNKKSDNLLSLFLYSGWELNPHLHYCKQDFKSCVSTNSTTRVSGGEKKIPLSGIFFRAEDRARTGHPDLGKVVLYQMSYFRILYKKELLQILITSQHNLGLGSAEMLYQMSYFRILYKKNSSFFSECKFTA